MVSKYVAQNSQLLCSKAKMHSFQKYKPEIDHTASSIAWINSVPQGESILRSKFLLGLVLLKVMWSPGWECSQPCPVGLPSEKNQKEKRKSGPEKNTNNDNTDDTYLKWCSCNKETEKFDNVDENKLANVRRSLSSKD